LPAEAAVVPNTTPLDVIVQGLVVAAPTAKGGVAQIMVAPFDKEK